MSLQTSLFARSSQTAVTFEPTNTKVIFPHNYASFCNFSFVIKKEKKNWAILYAQNGSTEILDEKNQPLYSQLVICCHCIIVRIKKTVGAKGTVVGMRELCLHHQKGDNIKELMNKSF